MSMVKVDPAPLPYGGLQYFQLHYIVQFENSESHNMVAKCEPITSGRFGNKRVTGVKWTGVGRFVERLEADSKLTEMLRKVLPEQGEIRIDPQDDHIRIYGKWIHEDRLAFSEEMLAVAESIASHIRHNGPVANED